jgi:hypothetical protein
MKRLILLAPLLCGGCIGEQTRAAFTLREPAPDMVVARVDHSAEHEANLERALDYSIRMQEAKDMREWNALGDRHGSLAIAAAGESCTVYNLDTDSCDSR